MRSGVVACLIGLLAALPLRAQSWSTIAPDEAMRHRSKTMTVCGIVRGVGLLRNGREGRIDFVSLKGETIWAVGAALLPLTSQGGELLGAHICARGRVYSNLEGVGVDVEEGPDSVQLVKPRDPSVPLPAPVVQASASAPLPASPVVEKKKRQFPWDAVIAGAIIGGAIFVATRDTGGAAPTTYAPGPSSTPPPAFTPTALAPAYGPRGTLWVETITPNGQIVVLSDDSVWEVNVLDRLHTGLWLSMERVVVAPGERYGEFLIVRPGRESARATRLR